VQRLLLSLEEISEPEFDRLWGEESARRAAEFDAGKAQAISGEEAQRKLVRYYGELQLSSRSRGRIFGGGSFLRGTTDWTRRFTYL
jgi:hypothetical protein